MIQDCKQSEAIGRMAQPTTRVSTDVSLPFGNFSFLLLCPVKVKEGKGKGGTHDGKTTTQSVMPLVLCVSWRGG